MNTSLADSAGTYETAGREIVRMGISTQARDGVPAETMQRSADALPALWGKQAETVVAENRAKQ